MIRHVTEALLEILRRSVADITPTVDVRAAPLEVVSRLGVGQLVDLYLYRVVESPELKNQGPRYESVTTTTGAQQILVRRDPLSVNLHFLLIPYALQDESYLETYELLGRAMKALHDNGIFSPGALGIATDPSELALDYRITLESLTVTELGQIWEAVHEPYRLSVSYVVRTVQILSGDTETTRRVSTRRLESGESREG
jgi:hypothetical protein